MSDVTLSAPRVRVVTDEDSEHIERVIQTDNRDAVRWDMTRGREGWPSMQDAPMLWSTFMAWSALKRSGETAEKFHDFNDRCLSVAIVRDDDGQPDEVGPTSAAPEPH